MSGETAARRTSRCMSGSRRCCSSPFPTAERRLDLAVSSVREMVDALDERWPGMRDCICDSTPAIRRHMNVFVDGKRATLDAPLAPGTDVFILTALSGG